MSMCGLNFIKGITEDNGNKLELNKKRCDVFIDPRLFVLEDVKL